MNAKKWVFMVTFVFILIVPVFAKDYVVLIHSGVNIRTGPSTLSIVIGKGSKGQIYHFFGEIDNWYKIKLFAGDIRYISKSLSSKLEESEIVPGHSFILPSKEAKQKDIYKRILRAKNKAKREAEAIIPISMDKGKNNHYYKILEDRYILEIFQNHEAHPALFIDLINTGIQNNW